MLNDSARACWDQFAVKASCGSYWGRYLALELQSALQALYADGGKPHLPLFLLHNDQ